MSEPHKDVEAGSDGRPDELGCALSILVTGSVVLVSAIAMAAGAGGRSIAGWAFGITVLLYLAAMVVGSGYPDGERSSIDTAAELRQARRELSEPSVYERRGLRAVGT